MHETSEGTFLVRLSTSNPNDYTLTVRKNGINKMIKIQRYNKCNICTTHIFRQPDGQVILGTEQFDSLPALVDHYRQHPLYIQEKLSNALKRPCQVRLHSDGVRHPLADDRCKCAPTHCYDAVPRRGRLSMAHESARCLL
jgi:hypothetical protein